MAQILVPSADSFNDGYTDQAGGTANIYTTIDEGVTPNDADYIKSPLAPTNKVYVTKVTTGEDPQSSTGHIIHFRYSKDSAGGAQIDLTVQLREGYVNEASLGTLIHEKVITNISNTITDDSFTLTGIEADSITNYGDLFLRYIINQV